MTRARSARERTVSALQIAGLVVILLLVFRVATGPRLVVPTPFSLGEAAERSTVDGDAVDVPELAENPEQTIEARRIRRVRLPDDDLVLFAGILLALGLAVRQVQAHRLSEPPRRVLTVTWRDSLLRRGPPLTA